MRFLETVNFVTPQVAVGGRYFWPRRLRKAGITHVLSARRTPDRLDGFVCLNNPMEDNGAPQDAAYWLRTVELAVPVLAEPNHKLFVHCAAGKNRGPAHVYAILLGLGHSPHEARHWIRTARRKATTRYFDNVEAALLGPPGPEAPHERSRGAPTVLRWTRPSAESGNPEPPRDSAEA